MKRYFLIIISIFMINALNVNVFAEEKGNPSAIYEYDRIILPDNRVVEISQNSPLLFINGSLVAGCETITRNNRVLVPVRLISDKLGAKVEWNEIKREVTIKKDQKSIVLKSESNVAVVDNENKELDYPSVIYKDSVYVPVRFIAENLGATVDYSIPLGTESDYYYDTNMPISPSNTIVRDFPNIIIDEEYDTSLFIGEDKAMEIVKQVCFDGLENFKKTTAKKLILAGESGERLDEEFKSIENEINRMIYIGTVSRYYKFTIGPYDILYDRLNGRSFFVIYSSGTIIEEVDINDEALFMPVFIVG